MTTLFLNILDPKRQKLLTSLKFLKEHGFYLAGGTALALQIGHRRSYDFDFYTRQQFDSAELLRLVALKIPQTKLDQGSEGSFRFVYQDVPITGFYYPYDLLMPVVDFDSYSLASLEDIAAMKVLAVTQRGMQRDFIDLYHLANMFSLNQILDLAQRKYPVFDRYTALKALVYFDDAQNESGKARVALLKPLGWGRVKSYFIERVRQIK
ncbi:MAG: nucleotidyl transferase AbiEii/AbiGii toxin family protein [Elusimicrobia bacterium]|nr:nucleotidyl transferase AbiEii/AbiGii toxin family protein [Elusimicrobiota bacterium]